MGIDTARLNDHMLVRMEPADRKRLGKNGRTKSDALHDETRKLERAIHDQFTSFCKRNDIIVWHSNPVRKASIRTGLPDFLCWRNGKALGIEFKVFPNTMSTEQKDVFHECFQCGNTVHVCEESPSNNAYAQAIMLIAEFFELGMEAR
jgi:hypothetical protein